MTTTTNSTALAVVGESTAIQGWEPENMGQGFALAEMLAKSSMIPTQLRGEPGDVMVVLMTGRDIGLTPMQSIRGIHVIEGKGVLSADMMVAVCKSRPSVCKSFRLVESNLNIATYETWRVGDDAPTRMSFTLEEATAAGLINKDTWRKFRAAMLRARAASALCRAVYPDLIGGFYDPDEAQGFGRDITPPDIAAQHPAQQQVHADATAETVVPAPQRKETPPPSTQPAAPSVTDEDLAQAFAARITDAATAKDSALMTRVGGDIAKAAWANKNRNGSGPYAATVAAWMAASARLKAENGSAAAGGAQ